MHGVSASFSVSARGKRVGKLCQSETREFVACFRSGPAAEEKIKKDTIRKPGDCVARKSAGIKYNHSRVWGGVPEGGPGTAATTAEREGCRPDVDCMNTAARVRNLFLPGGMVACLGLARGEEA